MQAPGKNSGIPKHKNAPFPAGEAPNYLFPATLPVGDFGKRIGDSIPDPIQRLVNLLDLS